MNNQKYINEQLKIVKKYVKKNGIKDLNNDIKCIENIYNKYNQNNGHYTSNYKN